MSNKHVFIVDSYKKFVSIGKVPFSYYKNNKSKLSLHLPGYYQPIIRAKYKKIKKYQALDFIKQLNKDGKGDFESIAKRKDGSTFHVSLSASKYVD